MCSAEANQYLLNKHLDEILMGEEGAHRVNVGVKLFHMLVAQSLSSHVCHPDASSTTAIGKQVTLLGMEFCTCDHLYRWKG